MLATCLPALLRTLRSVVDPRLPACDVPKHRNMSFEHVQPSYEFEAGSGQKVAAIKLTKLHRFRSADGRAGICQCQAKV